MADGDPVEDDFSATRDAKRPKNTNPAMKAPPSLDTITMSDLEKDILDPVSPRDTTKTSQTGVIRIHTDGSSLSNGQYGARAGLGVYFGPGDPR